MTNSSNPLQKHFRQPQLYIKLPSQGKYYSPGTIDYPVTGELPVLPMTARDELIYQTPDALLNGQATVDVIESCVPNIKDAWQMPACDLDTVLIGIRQATYGNEMEFTSVCPHCSQSNHSAVDLGQLQDIGIMADYQKETLELNGMTFYFQPLNYRDFNESSREHYEHQRVLQIFNNSNFTEEEKQVKFEQAFLELMNYTISHAAKNVKAIKVDNQLVNDQAQIIEFFENCDKKTWSTIEMFVKKLNEKTKLPEIALTCEHEACQKSYSSPLVFEQSNFFG